MRAVDSGRQLAWLIVLVLLAACAAERPPHGGDSAADLDDEPLVIAYGASLLLDDGLVLDDEEPATALCAHPITVRLTQPWHDVETAASLVQVGARRPERGATAAVLCADEAREEPHPVRVAGTRDGHYSIAFECASCVAEAARRDWINATIRQGAEHEYRVAYTPGTTPRLEVAQVQGHVEGEEGRVTGLRRGLSR